MQDNINQNNKDGEPHGYWEIIHADSVYTKGHYIQGDMYGYWITKNNSYVVEVYVAK